MLPGGLLKYQNLQSGCSALIWSTSILIAIQMHADCDDVYLLDLVFRVPPRSFSRVHVDMPSVGNRLLMMVNDVG